MNINPFKRVEAYVRIPNFPVDILLDGPRARNRAFNHEVVAVLIDPRESWPKRRGAATSGSVIPPPSEQRQEREGGDHDDDDDDNEEEDHNQHEHDHEHEHQHDHEHEHEHHSITAEVQAVLDRTQVVGLALEMQTNCGDRRPTGLVVGIIESKAPTHIVGTIELPPNNNSNSDNSTTTTNNNNGSLQNCIFQPQDVLLPLYLVDLPQVYLQRLNVTQPNDLKGHLFSCSASPWKANSRLPRCRVLQYLGHTTDFKAALAAINVTHRLPPDDVFPRAVDQMATRLASWNIQKDVTDSRTDCRHLNIFSIDPETAKDLDDALSVVVRSDGNYDIGVHIADVSYFVTPGSPMDIEAQRRATTFYLPWKNIPMLPRVLSDNLCSLLPGQDRLAFSIFWVMTPKGEVFSSSFTRTIIRSRAKLTYGMAQQLLDRQPDDHSPLPGLEVDSTLLQELHRDVRILGALGKQLRTARFLNGSVSLNSSKLYWQLDRKTFEPLSFSIYEKQDSNDLVEEFMLLANTAVAQQIHRVFPNHALVRRHPPPRQDRLTEFVTQCAKLGCEVDPSSSRSFNDFLLRIRQRKADSSSPTTSTSNTTIADDHLAEIIMLLARKPMELAQYTHTDADKFPAEFYHHYALNFPLYTHFTSPIRRYADIIVHRLLHATSQQPLVTDPLPRQWLSEAALQCNAQNRLADRAEDDASNMLLQQFILHRTSVSDLAVILAINLERKSIEVDPLRLNLKSTTIFLNDYPEFDQIIADKDAGTLTLVWKSTQAASASSHSPPQATSVDQLPPTPSTSSASTVPSFPQSASSLSSDDLVTSSTLLTPGLDSPDPVAATAEAQEQVTAEPRGKRRAKRRGKKTTEESKKIRSILNFPRPQADHCYAEPLQPVPGAQLVLRFGTCVPVLLGVDASGSRLNTITRLFIASSPSSSSSSS